MSYSKVSYITVNRTYFNIGYTATSTTKLYIKFKPHTGGSGDYDSTNTYIIGRIYTGGNNQFSINCFYNSRSTTETLFRFRYYAGSSLNDNFILNCPTEEIYEGTLSSTGVSINGGGKSSATTFSSTFTSSPIYLLGGNDEGNGFAGVVTLYEASIYENDVLVRHYIPYKDNETGYGVVYEEITGTYLNGVVPSDVIAGDPIFGIEPNTISFQYSGASSALTITCDGGWTASTNDSWLTISSESGSGDSTITITASANNGSQRNGVVSVTDGSDTLTCTISQDKHPVLVKSDNIYFEDTNVNKMYLNGALIYQNLFKFIFNVSTSAETFDYTGGTFSATITANRPWSLTVPEWISASSVSGRNSSTVTFTVGENSGETQRIGNIEVICNGVTKQINVSQKSQIDYSTMYLTFEIISGGTFGYSFWTNLNWEYTTDDGATWTTIPSFGAFSINVNAGDKIKMRGNESGGYGSNWFGWSTTTAKFNVYGNIMSIIDSVNFATMTTVPSNCFQFFFNSCTGLTSAENLVLPATTLADNCYGSMFYGCTSLTTAPELPATTLADNCYGSMFNGCTSLTTAPELPATTLADGCYRQMFYSCSSLTTAPELPATTLAYGCYQYMFYGCSSLNYIKCLATDISANSCTIGWVSGVAATGTFVKNPNMSSWETGNNGIPSGWTVLNV